MCRWFGALTSTLAAWLRPSRWLAWAHSGRRALPFAGWLSKRTRDGSDAGLAGHAPAIWRLRRPRPPAIRRLGRRRPRLRRLSLPTSSDLQRLAWRPPDEA